MAIYERTGYYVYHEAIGDPDLMTTALLERPSSRELFVLTWKPQRIVNTIEPRFNEHGFVIKLQSQSRRKFDFLLCFHMYPPSSRRHVRRPSSISPSGSGTQTFRRSATSKISLLRHQTKKTSDSYGIRRKQLLKFRRLRLEEEEENALH